jgi:GNAT superfamily N-acetyltransferase
MENPNLRIDKASPADIPVLVGLMREFYAEASFPLPEAAAALTFGALIGDTRLGQVWLISWEGKPAGFVVLTVCFSMEYGGERGFVDDFFVAPAFRGRGLGAAALAAVRRECEARGVRALLVETSEDNAGAVSVYRRAGFDDTGHLLLKIPLAAAVHES